MHKKLKKLEKLENQTNAKLEALISLWFKLVRKILPQSFFDYKEQTKQKGIEKAEQIKSDTKSFLVSLKDGIINFYQKILNFQEKINSIDIKEKLLEWLKVKKESLLSKSIKDYFFGIFKIFTPLINWMKMTWNRFSFSQLMSISIGISILIGATWGIYYSMKDIYQSEFPYREPASVQEYDYRPDYLMYKRKTVKFFNIKLPITVRNVTEIDSITIDFSVRTSTRFARYYLENYEYKLKDYFFTTVEPVVSDFPLKEEGKSTLKRKIKLEVDNFLRENAVEGNVEEVRILFIVGS